MHDSASRNPLPRARRDRRPIAATTAALAAAVAAARVLLAPVSASADQLPVEVRGGQAVAASVAEPGDTDAFEIHLFAGDVLTASVKPRRPVPDLEATLTLTDPMDADALPTVKGQGGKKPKLSFTATTTGTHTLTVTGAAGTSFGSTGDYEIAFAVKRRTTAGTTVGGAAAASLDLSFDAVAGSRVDVTAATKKGGFDLTALEDPDGDPEPGFAGALNAAANRRKASVKGLALAGRSGTYVLRGDVDAGSSVKVTVKVNPQETKSRRSLGAEPDVDALVVPFPAEGIPGTTFNIVGVNLSTANSGGLPAFTLGGVAVDPDDVENPFGAVYRFPVPSGLTTGVAHDLVVTNPDGQSARYDGAFTVVPPPAAGTFTPSSGGPLGGRSVRISGSNFRSGSVVLFGSVIAQPSVVLPDRIDVTAPQQTPGTVSLTVRDEFGQTSTATGTYTVLDVPSNRITAANRTSLQALGGEVTDVTGTDFGTTTVFTVDGNDVGAQRLSSTLLRFTMPPRTPGTATLRVTDDIEQTSALQVPVRGFTDVTTTVVPAPNTGANVADGWRATRILVGDVSGDGKADLVLLRPSAAFGSSSSRSRVRILRQVSGGTFVDRTATDFPAVLNDEDWRARDGVLADLDGDNDLDLAILTDEDVSLGNRSSLRVLTNDGTGVFTDRTGSNVPAVTSYGDKNQGVALAAVRLDNDSDVDLLVLHTDFFTKVTTTETDPGNPMAVPPIPPTIETTTEYFPGLRVFTNNGSALFTRATGFVPAVTPSDETQYQGSTMAVADFDGNGRPDVFLTGSLPLENDTDPVTWRRPARFLLANASGVLSDATATNLAGTTDPEYLQADRVLFADADGDTDLDVFVASRTALVSPGTMTPSSGSAFRLLLNTAGILSLAGSGTLPTPPAGDLYRCDGFAVGDLTGAGGPEIVLVSPQAPVQGGRAARAFARTGSSWIDGSAAFPHPTSGDDLRGADVVLLDVDGDGDLDVILARDDADETVRNLRVLRNDR